MKGGWNFTLSVLRGAFKRPATVKYMGGKLKLDPRVRGLISYDNSNCVACGLCMKDCPTGALTVVNKGAKEAREMHAYLDTGRCIFCGQCADSCAKHCISATPDADLAKLTRDGLTVEL